MMYALKSLRSYSVESIIVCEEDPAVIQSLWDNAFPAKLERRIRRLSSTMRTDLIWSPRGALKPMAVRPVSTQAIRVAREGGFLHGGNALHNPGPICEPLI